MAIGRGERGDTRQRREFQRLSVGLGFTFGDGLIFDSSASSLAVDIDPETTGILTFNAGGELTTQFVTTSGAASSVSVNVDPDVDFILTSGTGSVIRSSGNGIQGTDAAAQGGFVFNNDVDHQVYGPAGTLFLTSGTFGFFAVEDVDITISAAGESSGGSGVTGNIVLTGGSSAVVNGSGGDVFCIGGQPNGTGNSHVYIQVRNAAGSIQARFQANQTGIGFLGQTPIGRPGTYTLTAGTPAAASYALNASGNSGAAFTGIDNLQVGTPYAQLTDLNTLRAECANLAAVLRQLVRNLGDTAGFGLVNDTGY